MDNNWTINQTKKLFKLALKANSEGHGLVKAFTQMAEECNKSINSVRNYYYSQLKMFELVPQLAVDLGITTIHGTRTEFELFDEKEINNLIKNILIAKADGKSVRATIAELSGGSNKTALRIQNKYRSMISHHRDRVNAVMKELAATNKPYYNPYLKETVCGETPDNYKKLGDYISTLNSGEVDEFLSLMKKLFA